MRCKKFRFEGETSDEEKCGLRWHFFLRFKIKSNSTEMLVARARGTSGGVEKVCGCGEWRNESERGFWNGVIESRAFVKRRNRRERRASVGSPSSV